MAYDTEKCQSLEFDGRLVVDADKQFKNILKWCKKTLKDPTRWIVITTIYETKTVGFTTKHILKSVRFTSKEDYLLYKLSHTD